MSTRSEHLVRADRRFATGGGTLARFIAPAISKVLDEIERVAELIAPFVLIGWDTGGETWQP